MENAKKPAQGVNAKSEKSAGKVGVGPIKRKKRPKNAKGVSQDEAGCWLRENGKYTWKKLGRWGDPAVQERYREICKQFYVRLASQPVTPLKVSTLAGLFCAFLETRKPCETTTVWRCVLRQKVTLGPTEGD